MRAVRSMLESAGYDMDRYHQESFAAPVVAEPQQEPADAAGLAAADAAVAVRFSLSGIEADCLPGQTVLQTARAAGVRIPAACEFGLCGTCKVKSTSGSVEMNHNGGILDHEAEEGFILACCSKPLTALEIEA